jgi:hypothetical protein
MAIAQKPGSMVTGKVRLSFVHILEPHSQEEGKAPKYSACVLIPKSDKTTIAAIEKCVALAIATGKETRVWAGDKLPKTFRTPLRDGDEELETGQKKGAEYAGHFFLNASASIKSQPKVVDARVQAVIDPSLVYSGMYAKVTLNFYPYNKEGGVGIGAGLGNVQALSGGAPLGGRTRPEDDFDEELSDAMMG